MKTLINAVEEWIDLRIFANNKNAIFEAKFNEMEKIHIRDANRIAELERRVMILDGDNTFDAERATTIESRLDDLECSMEHKTDSDEVESMVESGIEDLDFPDSYAIEVMIDDALETKVMDAVKAELDATDFKITVER
tara:strand:+ start:504 stop:917 length:414 start_codon:yes stop_codon:yes gene_type:complete